MFMSFLDPRMAQRLAIYTNKLVPFHGITAFVAEVRQFSLPIAMMQITNNNQWLWRVTQAICFFVQRSVFSWALPAGVRIPSNASSFCLFEGHTTWWYRYSIVVEPVNVISRSIPFLLFCQGDGVPRTTRNLAPNMDRWTVVAHVHVCKLSSFVAYMSWDRSNCMIKLGTVVTLKLTSQNLQERSFHAVT